LGVLETIAYGAKGKKSWTKINPSDAGAHVLKLRDLGIVIRFRGYGFTLGSDQAKGSDFGL
jgi:hypothetical protein